MERPRNLGSANQQEGSGKVAPCSFSLEGVCYRRVTVRSILVNLDHLSEWIGKVETSSDQVTPIPVAALSATLDRDDPPPQPGDPLPLLWHWLYFLPLARQSALGPDGHPQRGGFLPPVTLPRRMIAAGHFVSCGALHIGDALSRVSRIADVSHKEGRTGPLVFVKVRHEISNAAGVVLTEDQDIVYREYPRPQDPAPAPKAAPPDATFSREIHPNEVLLFRYSALTFNGHRIHYDRRYATEVEGYPGLVVHGPLLATLLLDLLRRNLPQANIASFSFRAVRPLFDTAPFLVCGRVEDREKTVKLWAADQERWLAMEASATLA